MTDWEHRYRENDTPWDRGAAAPPIEEIDDAYFAGRILVPGCGFGYDVRRLSRPDNVVIGLDLSESALTQAGEFQKVAAESYLLANYFELPGELLGTFDAIFEHTCFCAIDPLDRSRYFKAAMDALKPGGYLVAIFYRDPDHEPGPPFPVTEEELDEIFQPGFDLVTSQVPKNCYPGREECEQIRILRRR